MPHLHAKWLASSRRSSQDRAEVFELGPDLVAVVADGAGGLPGGAVASDAFVEVVRRRIDDPGLDVHNALSWQDAFRATDMQLAVQMAGETTAVLIVVGDDEIFGISAGDSEAWLINATSIDDLTEHQKKARLGSGRTTPVAFHRSAVKGSLVIATDGLFKYARADAIAAAVSTERDAVKATQKLTRLAQLPSGTYHDDVAIVVVLLNP